LRRRGVSIVSGAVALMRRSSAGRSGGITKITAVYGVRDALLPVVRPLLTVVSLSFPLIGESFPLIGESFAFIRDQFALVRHAVALLCHRLAFLWTVSGLISIYFPHRRSETRPAGFRLWA
jgi:hypothetical protein